MRRRLRRHRQAEREMAANTGVRSSRRSLKSATTRTTTATASSMKAIPAAARRATTIAPAASVRASAPRGRRSARARRSFAPSRASARAPRRATGTTTIATESPTTASIWRMIPSIAGAAETSAPCPTRSAAVRWGNASSRPACPASRRSTDRPTTAANTSAQSRRRPIESCNGLDDDCKRGVVDDPGVVAAQKPASALCYPTAGTPCAGADFARARALSGWRCQLRLGGRDGRQWKAGDRRDAMRRHRRELQRPDRRGLRRSRHGVRQRAARSLSRRRKARLRSERQHGYALRSFVPARPRARRPQRRDLQCGRRRLQRRGRRRNRRRHGRA